MWFTLAAKNVYFDLISLKHFPEEEEIIEELLSVEVVGMTRTRERHV